MDAENAAGQSPLHLSYPAGDLSSVVALASYGANFDAVDTEGNTPLHVAVFVCFDFCPILTSSGISDIF